MRSVAPRQAGTIRKFSGPTTYNDYRQCGRCGIATSAEFCRDCKAVDPEFTAGGRTRRELDAERAVRQEDWHEFQRQLKRAGGKKLWADRRKGTRHG